MAAVADPFPPRHISRSSHHPKASITSKSLSSSSYIPTNPPILTIPDPYYGQEEIAKICARFISALFSCPDCPPPPPPSSTSSPSSPSSPTTPSPPLAQFIAYALHRTRLRSCVTFTALYLLSRLKTRFPAARGSSGHRLFISAFMIASKVVCDDTYSNKSWCVVGQGMFSLREINQMEREMCGYLEWHLNFDPLELQDFEAKTRAEYGGRSAAQSTRPVVPPLTIPILPIDRKQREMLAYPSPPSSPSPSTPSPSHSNSSSPESTTCLTPPSDNGPETVVSSGSSTAPTNLFSGSATSLQSSAPTTIPISSKGGLREPGFAFAAPAVW